MSALLHIVMAHAEAQPVFDRHLRFWEQEGTLWAMCPQDTVIRTPYPVMALGVRGHHNPASIHRFKQMVRVALQMDFDWYAIEEYDSFCLAKEIPKQDGVILSNLFTANQPEFKGHYFLHPPLVCSRPVLSKIDDAMGRIGDDAEGSFWDRFLGYACERFNIEMRGYEKKGFSRNTIEPYDIPAAVAARKAGVVCFHGVKSEAALNAILNAA